MAMEILLGSKPTTAPLRRITLYCDNCDSTCPGSGDSACLVIRGVDVVTSPTCCMGCLLAFIYRWNPHSLFAPRLPPRRGDPLDIVDTAKNETDSSAPDVRAQPHCRSIL